MRGAADQRGLVMIGGRGRKGHGVRMTVTIARDVFEHRALVSRHLESASRPESLVATPRITVRPFTEISPRKKGEQERKGRGREERG